MKLKTLTIALVAILFTGLTSYGQTVNEVVDNYFKAIGGRDKVKSIKTMKITGKFFMGPMEIPVESSVKKPNKVYSTATAQGMTQRMGFDGKDAWQFSPFMGDTVPHKMPEENSRDMKDQADIEGPLMDYKEKGSTVELIGKEDIEGTPAYKVKILKKSGDLEYYFIDAESFLLVKSVSKKSFQGKEVESETVYSDYRDVDGMKMAFSNESRQVGEEAGQKFIIDKVEVNVDMNDEMFLLPTK